MKGLSATQRTLRALRDQGRICEIAERWQINPRVPGGGYRKDLFGFIDVLALDPEQGIVAIQSCTTSMAAHVRKILEECTEAAEAWLKCGGRIEVWAWRKVKLSRGGVALRWRPLVRQITSADFGTELAAGPAPTVAYNG